MKRSFLALGVVISTLGVTACGSSETATVTQVTVVKTEAAAAAKPAAAETVTVEAAAAEPAAAEPVAAKAADDGRKRVPDVVGMNHENAQNRLRDLGFENLGERDATGQDRLLLWDRNWQVVKQSPAAGTKVDPDRAIVLSSKKFSD